MIAAGRLRVALRESLRTTAARPWRFALGVAIGGLIMAAPATFEVTALDSVTDVLADEETRGAYVLIVESEEGALDGRDCSAVAGQQGVVAAGGMTAPKVVSVGEPALTTARSAEATAGYFEIVWGREPRSSEPAVIVGSELGRELSVADGAQITLGGDQRFAASSASASAREDPRGRWLTIPAAHLQSVQQCWVEASPESLAPVRASLPALFPDAQALSVTVMRDGALSEAAITGWVNRPGRWLHLVCGAVAGAIVGTLLSPRRAEYALYRLLGLSRPTVLVIAIVEAMLLVQLALVLGGLICAAVVPALAPLAPADILSSLLVQIAMTGAAAAAVAGLTCVLLTSGNPAQTIRSHR
ncbi:ABC transporter permease [Microbacterium sp. Root180]|uniref:ABC transporter permease n=1 Tax=Microbacterium sp. Root180 TaxID=1736483 RepID=UPI000700D8D7|nr:ABC transporter permease [Microbacterium sp. Root180]KRB38476.1 hypothetical protein ASD93_00435 [Microbacterium sp. Root180]